MPLENRPPLKKVSPGGGVPLSLGGLEVELDISNECYFTITIHLIQ